jgi:hypothetical protein
MQACEIARIHIAFRVFAEFILPSFSLNSLWPSLTSIVSNQHAGQAVSPLEKV